MKRSYLAVLCCLIFASCGPSSNTRQAEPSTRLVNPASPGLSLPVDEIKALPRPTSFIILGKSAFGPTISLLVKHKNSLDSCCRFFAQFWVTS